MEPRRRGVLELLGQTGRFLVYVLRRFKADNGLQVASALSYTSLLALVPLIAVGLAILAAFPAFEEVRVDLRAFILENMLPSASAVALESLSTFIDNAGSLTAVGSLGLAAVAIMLISTINGAMDTIWRVRESRPLVLRILVYWTVLTLGPLLIGASVSLSSYAFAVVEWSGLPAYANPQAVPLQWLALPLSAIAFTLFYWVMPNRPVNRWHALAGGIAAAVLFDLLKRGFGLYLRAFPTYETIYGAVAAMPIFLLWMYLCWSVVLLGAQITAALPEWRAARDLGLIRRMSPSLRLAIALTVLRRLLVASRGSGRAPNVKRLVQAVPATPAEVDSVLDRLDRAGYIERTRRDSWVLAKDLSRVRLVDLVTDLRLNYSLISESLEPQVQAIFAELQRAEAESMSGCLSDLLDEMPDPAEGPPDLVAPDDDVPGIAPREGDGAEGEPSNDREESAGGGSVERLPLGRR